MIRHSDSGNQLQGSGKIYKDNKEVGHYSFSYRSDSYSFQIGMQVDHFYSADELVEELTRRGYTWKPTSKC